MELGGVLYVTLWIYALLRFEDYFHRGQLANILRPSYEAYFLWLELLLALIIPLDHSLLPESAAEWNLVVPGLVLNPAGVCNQPAQREHHGL